MSLKKKKEDGARDRDTGANLRQRPALRGGMTPAAKQAVVVDYSPKNKINSHAISKLLNRQINETNEQSFFFLIKVFQVINREGMRGVEKHH